MNENRHFSGKQMDELEQREHLYRAIANVVDLPTRRILYIQFINQYYPEAEEAILGALEEQFQRV